MTGEKNDRAGRSAGACPGRETAYSGRGTRPGWRIGKCLHPLLAIPRELQRRRKGGYRIGRYLRLLLTVPRELQQRREGGWRIRKSLRPFLALLSAALLLWGCGSGSPQGGRRGPYKMFLVVKSVETEFWRSAIAGANAAGSEYNVDLTVLGPETEEDYEQQNAYIRQAAREGADAVVFSAISYTGNAEAVRIAAEAGLKIVVIDSDVDSPEVDVRIGTDNVQAGRMTAEAVLDTDEKELYVGIVNFDLESRNGQERETGLREELEKDGRVREMYTVNVAATPDAAREGTLELLRAHPEINALVGLNEPLAVGTGSAVRDAGKTGEVRVVGFDTNVQCVDMMREGAISALIAQNPYAMGYLGIECAWKLLEGGTYDSGAWLDTSTTIITQENMFSPESQKALFSFG